MSRKPGLLKKIEGASMSAWLDSIGAPGGHRDTIDELLDPGRKQVARMTDEELAELLGRGTGSKLGQLAASEMRVRESWRMPARWSLIVAILALLVSAVAFVRTL